jgi:hypothetical protein
MSDWVGFEEALAILTEGMAKEMWADGRPLPKHGEPWPDDWPEDRQFRRGAVTLFLQDEVVQRHCRVMGRRNRSAVHEDVSPVKMRSLEILSTVGKPVPPSDVPEAILMPPEHTMEERDTEWRNDIYYEVRFIRDEIEKLKPRFRKWLDGEQARTAVAASREGDAALAKRIECVLAYARDRFPKGSSFRAMARHIKAQKRDRDFSEDALRQILSGRYPPMIRLGIEGLAPK